LQKNLDYRVIALLFADGVLNWLQNIIAFSVLSLVTPLTYAVASASKRIFVIAVSLLILGNPVTWVNCLGMTLAIVGVLCYNRAKQMTRGREKPTLPLSQNSHVKYSPLEQHTDPYYRGSVNGKLSNGLHRTPGNSLLANGSGMPNGTTTRLLFV